MTAATQKEVPFEFAQTAIARRIYDPSTPADLREPLLKAYFEEEFRGVNVKLEPPMTSDPLFGKQLHCAPQEWTALIKLLARAKRLNYDSIRNGKFKWVM